MHEKIKNSDPDDAPLREEPHLLVVMPALNEERTVAQVVRSVPREIPGVGRVDVVVIDDGSDDRTADRAADAGAKVISHPTNRGVGAAFQTALRYGIECGADLIATLDSDGQFDPGDIPQLIEPVIAGTADFSTASRFKDPELVPEMPRIKLWGNLLMSRIVSRLAKQSFHDVSCGMRCYSRLAALRIHPLGRFTYTQEVFLNLAFNQLRVAEVPIPVRGQREFGSSRVAGNLWRYAMQTSQIILRCYRDYQPLRFFGGISLALAVSAFGLGGMLLVHYLHTGGFTPHKWAGFTSMALLALALIMLHTGVIGDMMNRHRVYLEEILYLERVRSRTTRD
ncbi:MAG: glycosyltransferase family 2 protein [Deltaproteobacteria bacterium]|nr:glycosyltransferase family 2 protein [Deltaproteobacteria bacterium]MBW2691393.1 glycosyltransferase family 2 protein [Deltaproteobacteria bacterium]